MAESADHFAYIRRPIARCARTAKMTPILALKRFLEDIAAQIELGAEFDRKVLPRLWRAAHHHE